MFWIYILRSKKTNKYYTVSTQNVSVRFKEHNAGKSRSTQGGVPWHLVYYSEYESRAEAVRAEKQIKGMGAQRFLASLNRQGEASGSGGPPKESFGGIPPAAEKANMISVRLFYFRVAAFSWTVAGSNR